MFDKFGEFDSAEELNKAAEGLRNEGDRESLIELAKENGIDPEDAEDYFSGEMEKLAGNRLAAVARLKVEKESFFYTGHGKGCDLRNGDVDGGRERPGRGAVHAEGSKDRRSLEDHRGYGA